jgi:hypothetical protein
VTLVTVLTAAVLSCSASSTELEATHDRDLHVRRLFQPRRLIESRTLDGHIQELVYRPTLHV